MKKYSYASNLRDDTEFCSCHCAVLVGALFALILQPQGLLTFLFVVLSCVKLLTFGCNLCALILGGHYSMVWVERDLGDNFVQSSTGPVQPGLGQSQGWDICISVQVLYK